MSDKLRALAEAATPGPWLNLAWQIGSEVDGFMVADAMRDEPEGQDHRDAAFIAAANPAVVLGLLDELDALRAQVERVRAECTALAKERDELRENHRAHNANRREGRPPSRPDIGTWADAYEVAERRIRSALGGDQ